MRTFRIPSKEMLLFSILKNICTVALMHFLLLNSIIIKCVSIVYIQVFSSDSEKEILVLYFQKIKKEHIREYTNDNGEKI